MVNIELNVRRVKFNGNDFLPLFSDRQFFSNANDTLLRAMARARGTKAERMSRKMSDVGGNRG